MSDIAKTINENFIDNTYKKRYFKQINVNDKFSFCEYIDNKYIDFKNAVLHLPCVNLIDTIEGVSYEGQRLSGKKLVLCGYLDTSFYINYGIKSFYIKKDIPLSTFIVVPGDTNKEDYYYIDYCIEDVTITNIECNYVFISITLFIEYICNNKKVLCKDGNL